MTSRQVPSRQFWKERRREFYEERAQEERARVKEDRARAMYRLRTVEGLTLRQVGERHGVSQARAHQIIIAYVSETTGRPPELAELSRAAAEIRGDLRAERRAEAERKAKSTLRLRR